MSERMIFTKKARTCDLCGQSIAPRSWCRLIKDDFMPGIFYFEHLRCPTEPVTSITNKQKHNKQNFAFA